MQTKLIDNFDLKTISLEEGLDKRVTDVRINGKIYKALIQKISGEKSMKLKFPEPKEDLLEVIAEGKVLVLIFGLEQGIYHIPLLIEGQQSLENSINCLVRLEGSVLHVERRRFERVEINKHVNYFIGSEKYEGVIENINAVGALLPIRSQESLALELGRG